MTEIFTLTMPRHSPKIYEATYLGNELNREINVKHEILNKLQTVRITWFKLLPYWKASDANIKWKLRIFDAVIPSQVVIWFGNGSSYKSHVEQNRRIPDPRIEENPQPPVYFY